MVLQPKALQDHFLFMQGEWVSKGKSLFLFSKLLQPFRNFIKIWGV